MRREFQKRTIRSEIRLNEQDNKRTLLGFIPYNKRSVCLGGFYEYIMPTAFNKTLSDKSDVKALVAHDTAKILGRVKNGSLRLESKNDGLYIECDLPDTTYARDVYELIRNDYCNTMSFGFEIINQDYAMEEGREVHYLKEVKLDEVSFGVAFPAYEATDSFARSIRGINLEALAHTLDKEEFKDEDFQNIQDTIDSLRNLLPVKEESAVTENTGADQKVTSAVDENQQFLNDLYEGLKALNEV